MDFRCEKEDHDYLAHEDRDEEIKKVMFDMPNFSTPHGLKHNPLTFCRAYFLDSI